MGNIAGAYNAGTGAMTLTSAGGTATLAQWQVALRAVQYSNSSDNPSTSARTVSYVVNDGTANSNTVTSTVNVAAVNDAPVLATGSTLNYTENAAATAVNTALTVTDLDNGTLASATVSITGGLASGEDALSFTNLPATMGNITRAFHSGTAVMSLSSAGATATLAQWQVALRAVQYSNSSDNPSTTSRTVTFAASDGALGANTVASTINIAAVNDAPTVTSSTTATVTEGISTATVVYTATSTDPDGPAPSWSLSGADATAFSINAATGTVTFNASPDFEAKSSYSFNVVASDGALTGSEAVTINVTDVAPGITSATTATVVEGVSTATVVYAASATDPAGGTVTYALTGADAGAFTINSSTGAVTFNSSPDFETKSSYSFDVKASDPSGAFNTQTVTISVTDVAPGITSATTATVAEGTSTATVVYTASATDVAGGTVTYSVTGADAGAFTINSSTAAVPFNASPDFETKSSYSFNVNASDATGAVK